jgi:hypothetical protein
VVEEPQLVEVLLVAVVAAVVAVFLVEGAVEAVEGVSSMMGLRLRLQVYSALVVLLTINSHGSSTLQRWDRSCTARKEKWFAV